MRLYSIFLISLLFLGGCNSSNQTVSENRSRLWYEGEAKKWIEALPLGNGRLGAMVFGGVDIERLQLNEESLWAGEPIEVYPDNFSENIKIIQKLVLDGKIAEAKALGIAGLTKEPTSFRSYQPLADIIITMDHAGKVTDYIRDLDLQSGISKVKYSIDGVAYTREYFISAVDDIVVLKITSDTKGAVSCRIEMARERDASFTTRGNAIYMKGQIVDIEAPEAYDDNPGGSGPGGAHMKFDGKLVAKNGGGNITSSDGSLMVTGADEVIVLFSASTDYNTDIMCFDRNIDPAAEVEKILSGISDKKYRQIRKDHITEHSSMFNRVSLTLPVSEISSLPTNIRLEKIKEGVSDPEFSALYFQFGRYLLMSSSRSPGRLPANLQGVWNDRMWAPWEADYHLNINLQMNYWPADLCNLSETIEPLTRWLLGAAEKGRVSAKRLYNSDGWMLYLATNPFGRSTPSASTIPSQFMNGSLDPLPGAWMSLTLWRHYEFTGDLEYLEESVAPLLVGASRFLLDYMVEDRNGSLVIVPSTSPENNFIDPSTGEKLRITRASTYHSSIVREVFGSTLKALEILESDNPIADEIRRATVRIPPIKVGSDGTIMEWIEEYEEAEPGHRHVSHLIGLHPFAQITSSDNNLFEASRKTIERRLSFGGGHTGWSRAWMVNFSARLGDGDSANEHLKMLYSKSTHSNLFDVHPPFQIDGNFGGTSGIAEMLLQSHNGYIEVLPALPTEWSSGSINGVCARGGFVVDIEWSEGIVTELSVYSALGGKCTIKYKNKTYQVNTSPRKRYRVDL